MGVMAETAGVVWGGITSKGSRGRGANGGFGEGAVSMGFGEKQTAGNFGESCTGQSMRRQTVSCI